MTTTYTTPQAYFQDYLRLLSLRLQREVIRLRARRGTHVNESFLGLFLSDAELNAILSGLHDEAAPSEDQQLELGRTIAEQSQQIAARLATAPRLLPFQQLANLFELCPAAVDLIQLLMAVEIDSRFARVYAFLQDDVTRRWMTPGLAWHLLELPADSPAARELFAPASSLMVHQLVHLTSTENGVPLPLVSRPLKLDDRIVNYLLGQASLDSRLAECSSLILDLPYDVPGPVDREVHHQIVNLLSLWHHEADSPAFFWGPPGSGKEAAVHYLAAAARRPLLEVQAGKLPPGSFHQVWALVRREQRLQEAFLHLPDFERLDNAIQQTLWPELGPHTIVSSSVYPPHLLNQPHLLIQFPTPGHTVRRGLWQTSFNGHGRDLDPGAVELAAAFRLTAGQIRRAAQTAQQLAWLREGPGGSPSADDLFEGAHRQSNPGLSRLATKVVSPHRWEDLVLPVMQLAQLRAIMGQMRHADVVYEEWGFAEKLSYGRSLTALFSGPSGTGKTMAAGILARTLGLDLYKINLASVVSKYIGETEKNLDAIFAEATTANAVLFFDEADALFGKRSEVKDAHDRYANIEISYLLQKMEEYEGMAILASNLSQNLDEAFQRRLQFIVEFPFPQPPDRERIWQGLFPKHAPLSGDVDFSFLASQFELTGGNIKNCVLAAAFAAAETREPIGMTHLVQAVAGEMGKLGQPLQRSAFADYFSTIKQNRRAM